MELITSLLNLKKNIEQFDRYLEEGNDKALGLVGRGKVFVVYRAGGEIRFVPSRYIGYKDNSLKRHANNSHKHGTKTTQAINKVLGINCKNRTRERQYVAFCKKFGIHPRKGKRTFFPKEITRRKILGNVYPDDVSKDKSYIEGAVKKVSVKAFERNPDARKKCIKFHGCKCAVCDFDFEATYGNIGKGYIHVHHIKPLSKVREVHEVCPSKDLIPVCPNCHAMLHRGCPVLTVEELKKKINAHRLRLTKKKS